MNIRRFFVSFWPSLITLSVVLYATLWPNPELPGSFPAIPHLDKLIHALMFGGLYGAIVFDIRRDMRRRGIDAPPGRRVLFMLALEVAAFGAVDELLQELPTQTRCADVLDFAADCGGIFVAAMTAPPAVKAVLRMKH